MNWEAIGAIAGIIGVALVIISLVYVGVQIGQSNKQSRSQARQSLIDTHGGLNSELSKHPDLVKILSVGLADWTDLDDIEKMRFDFLMTGYLANLHRGLLQYDDGILDKDTLDDIANNMLMCIAAPGGKDWFTETVTPTKMVRKYLAERLDSTESASTNAAVLPPYMTEVANDAKDS